MSALLTQNHFIREFLSRLSNSRFFTVSLLLHLLIVILFGTKALIEAVQDQPDMVSGEAGEFVSTDPNPVAPQPPAQPQQQKQEFKVQPTQAMNAPSALSAIASTTSAPTNFMVPSALTPAPTRSNVFRPPTETTSVSRQPSNPTQLSKEALAGIAGFTSGWSQGGGGGTIKNRKFKFTAYLAKYNGGDWYSSVDRNGDKIVKGSLPNLLYLMQKMSQDKIVAKSDPVALDLASDKIFVEKPPFIFLTGHRDFVLTDKEVQNLQRYIMLGGAIWGDSSLPGARSRFDIAFRREMKRVIPDIDKQFEPLPADHDIFTKTYYSEIRGVPTGVNFYQEPVYALKYNGEIAILYTANDYGDMWQIGLNERWKVDTRQDERRRYVAINGPMWENREIYYRGLSEESVATSFKFGTNVVIHLLTRWENKVRSVQTL